MYYLSFEPGILLNVKSVIFIHVAACDSVAFLVMARRCSVTYTHNTHSPFKNQWIPRLILCWPIVYTANINMGVQMVFDMLISSPPPYLPSSAIVCHTVYIYICDPHETICYIYSSFFYPFPFLFSQLSPVYFLLYIESVYSKYFYHIYFNLNFTYEKNTKYLSFESIQLLFKLCFEMRFQ